MTVTGDGGRPRSERARPKRDQARPDPDPPASEAPDGAADRAPDRAADGAAAARSSRGADLAAAALEAARARNAAARAAATGRRTPRRATAATGSVRARMTRRRWSGPGPDKRRDPQPLGDVLSSWVSSTGARGELAKAALFARWAELVGPGIADHCAPESLVDGHLVLVAESTAWATQLRMMAPQLVARINAEIGRGTVARIRAKGPTGPSWRFGNRHVPGRGPRDTYG